MTIDLGLSPDVKLWIWIGLWLLGIVFVLRRKNLD